MSPSREGGGVRPHLHRQGDCPPLQKSAAFPLAHPAHGTPISAALDQNRGRRRFSDTATDGVAACLDARNEPELTRRCEG